MRLTPLAYQLDQRATAIAEHLLARKLATQPEIDACYSEAEEPDLKVALAYAALRALVAERAPDKDSRKSRKEKANRVLLDALGDVPAYVDITRNETPLRVAVYPKSYTALKWFDLTGRKIEWLVDTQRKLESRSDPEVIVLLERAGIEEAFQYQRMVVAATTPGCGLPWEPDDTSSDLPEWAYDLGPTEILAVRNAFVEVNALRLSVMHDVLSPTKKNGDAPELSWAQFFSLRSEESGLDTPILLRDRSLPSQIAASALASDAKLQAMEPTK